MNLTRFLSAHRLTATRLAAVVIIAAFWLLRIHPAWALLIGGTALAVAGQSLRLWAAGHLVKSDTLTITGPFAYTRHPLYLGSTLIGLGLCTASGMWWSFVLVGVVFGVFYVPTARHEEEFLRGVYGEAYARYCEAVPAFGVRLSRYGASEPISANPGGGFEWARIVRNREHHTAVATVILLAALWAGALVRGGGA
jgi:protein-S-isoprenylcysteine O-methyltransferase Ste14